MRVLRKRFRCVLLLLCILPALIPRIFAGESQLPAFGRDTVLVWKVQSQDFEADFVVRIAEFSPDRYLEWEDEKTQGTIFMPEKDILDAKGFISADLFESGIDSRGKNATTLWLSRRIYRELKAKKKSKCHLDNVPTSLTYLGDDHLAVEVNRSIRELPVIRVADDRGSEWWFLDQEDNPLMLRHMIRKFNQVLTSITTDRPNTLRWIKGRKLTNLPH